MGLTIHYTIGYKGTADQLLSKLNTIRSQCLDLPVEEVREIEHVHYRKEDLQFYFDTEKKTFYPNNTTKAMQAAEKAYQQKGLDREVLIDLQVFHRITKPQAVELLKWSVWAGKGCEGTAFHFVRQKKTWKCISFTKTPHAEQFVKCHLLVIQVLDLFKEQGFTVKVKDEGKYWETRDLSVLAENINDYTDLLKTLFGSISKQAKEAGMTVEAPITECQNYMKSNDKK